MLLQVLSVAVLTTGTVEEVPVDSVHRLWWNQMQECTGIQRDITPLHIRTVPDSVITAYVRILYHGVPSGGVGHYYLGLADPTKFIIYVERGYEHNRKVVSHEMIHILMQMPGHPIRPFAVPCRLLFTSRKEAVDASE